MKYNTLLAMALALSLTGCFERDNPLKSYPADDVSAWVYKNKTPDIMRCAKFWENQAWANPEDLKSCDSTTATLADTLSKAGFGTIKPEDVLLPTIWGSFNEHAQASQRNKYDPEKAAKAMQMPEKGSLGEKIEAYKRERDKSTKE